MNRRRSVQSVEIGVRVLIKLSELGPEVSLSELADATELHPSKAHRYVSALVASGVVAQSPATGLYHLGMESLAIGLAALRELDIVALSGDVLTGLRDEVRHTAALSVWANKGPTVVRIEPALGSVVVNVRVGSVLPLLTSATGVIFASFLEAPEVKKMAAEERKALRSAGRRDLVDWVKRSIALARRTRLAAVRSTLTPGVSALAAPVFDHQSALAGVLTALGPETHFDTSSDGEIAGALRRSADATSRLLGSPRAAPQAR